ncbi:hypothetical protein [Geodermatophilus sp. SYSU D00815]
MVLPFWLTSAVGALAGALTAPTMAAVTGWGLLRLVAGPPPR